MRIGLVGLGRMGSAIAARLAQEGAAPLAWDVNERTRESNALAGVKIADNACSVARGSDIVISIVSEDNAVRTLFEGPDGFFDADISGKLFIEMTTLQPMTVRTLSDKVQAKGARIIDSPVLGSIPTAREGKLFALVGGTAEDLDHAKPVHSRLTRHVEHLGPVGSGSAMKLGVNMAMAAYLQALSEALALGAKNGLAIRQMLDVLSQAPTANPWLAMKKEILAGETGDITMDIRTMRKDIMSAVATGALSGVAMPLSSGALSALSAAVAGGWGDLDVAELPRFFREEMLQNYA